MDFSHITLDTLALQCNGTNENNQVIGNHLSFVPDHSSARKWSIAIDMLELQNNGNSMNQYLLCLCMCVI